jgi:hypothetical protein
VEILDVRKFGAKGDGVADDTGPIQNALNAIDDGVSIHGPCRSVYVPRPPGEFYKITAPLDAPDAQDFAIFGDGRSASRIRQFTDNAPIIRFAKNGTFGAKVANLGLGWNTPQTASHPDSYGIQFAADEANPGDPFWTSWHTYHFSELAIDNCFRGIGIKEYASPVGPLVPWNITMSGISVSDPAGSAFYVDPQVAWGLPGIKIRDTLITNYNRANVEPHFHLVGCVGGELTSIDAEMSMTNPKCYFDTCSLVITNFYAEHDVLTQSNSRIFFCGNGSYTFDGISLNAEFQNNDLGIIFHGDGGSKVTVSGLRESITRTNNAAVTVFSGSNAEYFLLDQPVLNQAGSAAEITRYPTWQTADILGRVRRVGRGAPFVGTGSPEGVVTAPVGNLYLRADGGANTTLYAKESGTGNTGWAAKGGGTGGTAAPTFPMQFDESGTKRILLNAPYAHSLTSQRGIGTVTVEGRKNQNLQNPSNFAAVWVPTNVSVTADDTTDPAGTTTADRLTPVALTDAYIMQEYTAFNASDRSFAFGAWLKADTAHQASLHLWAFNEAFALIGTSEALCDVTTAWQFFTLNHAFGSFAGTRLWAAIVPDRTQTTLHYVHAYGAELFEEVALASATELATGDEISVGAAGVVGTVLVTLSGS